MQPDRFDPAHPEYEGGEPTLMPPISDPNHPNHLAWSESLAQAPAELTLAGVETRVTRLEQFLQPQIDAASATAVPAETPVSEPQPVDAAGDPIPVPVETPPVPNAPVPVDLSTLPQPPVDGGPAIVDPEEQAEIDSAKAEQKAEDAAAAAAAVPPSAPQ